MIPLELQLLSKALASAAANASIPPSAFLIPSGDARVWLDQLAEFAASAADPAAGAELLQNSRLLLVPVSRRNLTPAALLVIPPEGYSVKLPPRALPYTAAGRLFYPADAVLYPPLSDAELTAIVPWELALFHPTAGIIGYVASDIRTIADLLAPPVQRRQRMWNCAIPGPAPAQALLAIEVEMRPPQQLLEEGRDDIGTALPQNLPRLPGESSIKPIVQAALSAPLKWAAAMARYFNRGNRPAQPPPNRAGTPAPNIAPDWFQRLIGRLARRTFKPRLPGANFLNSMLEEQRARELQRLMHLLDNSPDEGLRHAIPLGPNAAPRGFTSPGGRLGDRDVNFSLAGLRGGRPVDPWNIPADFQANLRKRYRELANRELGLGRFRRAAYILAELLGDLPAAASALKQGRLFREAAAIYRDNLKQVRMAAACLEEGGLLTEALTLYNVLGDHEKIGDLCLRLDRHAEAQTAYRARVRQLLATEDRLGAAVVLEKKLHDLDGAIATLDDAWPHSATALRCVEEAFALRARIARHTDAAARIAFLRQNSRSRSVPLAETLARLARSYPDAAVKTAAADATRVLAAHAFPDATPEQERHLIRAITSLDESDHLLARDGRRYLNRPQPIAVVARNATSRRTVQPPTLVRRLALPELTWCAALAVGDQLIACGYAGVDVVLAQARFTGGVASQKLSQFFHAPPDAPPRDRPQFLLAPILTHDDIVDIILHEVTTPRHTPGQARHPKPNPLVNVSPAPAHAQQTPLLGLCADDAGTHWAITGGQLPALSAWDMSFGAGLMRSTHDLAPWLGDLPLSLGHPAPFFHPTRIPMIARGNHLFFAIGPRLVHLSYLRTARHIDLPGDILRLAASDALSRIRIAAVSAAGCLLISADGRDMKFAEGMDAPIITFTRGGTLIARDDHELRLYQTESDRLTHTATFPMTTPRPVALLPTPLLNEFASLDRTGALQIFSLPS